jgi:KDO2-lipid IV(A) lauroyltransferase
MGPARYAVADAAGLCAWAIEPRRRRRAVANHRRNQAGIDEREARRRARQSFREYARTIADFLWANRLDAATAARHSRLEGMSHIDALRDSGRGGIVVLTHFGSWDMAANMAVAIGLPLTTVMAPVGPPAITALVSWARAGNELEVFTPESAARGLLRALRRGRFLCLLCDVPGGGPTVVVDYCGGPVAFSVAPARLARASGAPLIPVECWRVKGGFRAQAHPPIEVARGDDETAVMQRVAAELEVAVRRHPGQWYPFGTVYTDAAPSAVR